MQDLSGLAKNSMWVTSQAGGNMTSSSAEAFTAPGSEPVDPVPDRDKQGDPHVDLAEPMPPATSGKPQAASQVSARWSPGAPAWGPVTVPDVVRTGKTGTAK